MVQEKNLWPMTTRLGSAIIITRMLMHVIFVEQEPKLPST